MKNTVAGDFINSRRVQSSGGKSVGDGEIAGNLNCHEIRSQNHRVALINKSVRADCGRVRDSRRAVRFVTDKSIVVFSRVRLSGEIADESIVRARRVADARART